MERNMKSVADIWEKITKEIRKVIVGQDDLIKKLLLAIIVEGHVLVEGSPGLAKTLAIKTLARATGASFSRIQFTPDLLPADITGTQIYHQSEEVFKPHKGPVFSNMVLADEINRAPAKVQSALLQAMEEYSITLGKEVHRLPKPFFVMATQNPIEHEGTYELPEAQMDRFLFKLELKYPSVEEELGILNRIDTFDESTVESVCSLNDLINIGKLAKKVKVDDSIKQYVVNIVYATRNLIPTISGYDHYIEYGVSPRATLALLKCGRVQALLKNRNYIIPEDVKMVAPDILRHRIILSFDAIANGISTNYIVKNLLENVAIPK